MTQLKHIFGILSALALALIPTWGTPGVPLAGKIAISITIAMGVVFSTQKRAEVVNLLLGVCGIAGPLLTIWLARIPAGTSAGVVGGTVLAVISNLRAALGQQGPAVVATGDAPGKVLPISADPPR